MSLSKAIGVVSGVNEFGNLFQLVSSAVSYLRSKWDGTQEQQIQEDDVLQLQSNLRHLSDNLPAMYNLIDRAEWRSHEHCVAELLPKLKDAVYDAEDLLDEFRWYELKLLVESNETEPSPFIDFFRSVIHGRFNKVVDILNRQNSLSSQLEKMGLPQTTPRFDKSIRPETSSFPTEPKNFGRDDEMEELIRLLGVLENSSRAPSRRKRRRSGAGLSTSNQVCIATDSNEAMITSVPVLAIVGIGGVGKTTLAQNICKHLRDNSRYFDHIMWVCVSDEFDVKRLTREVIQSCSGCEAETVTDHLDSLQGALAKKIERKRFLLILDDMWDDALKENGQRWKRFKAPFTNVLQGSIMLVTTRSLEVANHVRTIESFQLEGLKDDIFWDFFKLCAFGPDSSNNDPELEQIGKKILPKLKGSPLAAKTIGRLLGMRLHPTHWDRILKSELWELTQEDTDILPALRLSYTYLPFHLKRCFSFCAVYPKDHYFNRDRLVEFWVAEGFVEHQSGTPIKDIGHRYFDELASRSFFQETVSNKYVIHDLMHDMAQLVAKDECFILQKETDLHKVPETVRHLSIASSIKINGPSLLLSLLRYRKLRTLVCSKPLTKRISGDEVMKRWCSEFQCMRFFSCASEYGLPEDIKNMKHLRYLEISASHSLKSLPSGLCCLYSLQFFYATDCYLKGLPREMYKLINLQTFYSETLQYCRSHPSCMVVMGYPGESLDSWFHSRSLTHILTSDGSCSGPSSFGHPVLADNNNDNTGSIFLSLEGLTIKKCQKLSSLEQCLCPAYVPAIKKILVEHCEKLVSLPTSRFVDMHFLKELKVSNCPNIKSQELSAPSLLKLELLNSGNLGDNIECRSLTDLDLSNSGLTSIQLKRWSLPALQKLRIAGCPSLTSIRGTEPGFVKLFHHWGNSSIRPFSSLTELLISNCSKLQTLDDLLTQAYLPAIKIIRVENCEDLLSLPGERFRSFPFLNDLIIHHCPRLNWQRGMVLPSSLQRLSLHCCGYFSTWLPSCLENLTSLENLHMVSCEGTFSIPGHLWSSNLASLKELRIESCPNLVSIGGQNTIANIAIVHISNCQNLKEVQQPLRRGVIFLWK